MILQQTIILSLLLSSAGALLSASAPIHARTEASLAERCKLLAGPRDGGVRITSATAIENGRQLPPQTGVSGEKLPPHCLVEGMINQRVGADGVTYGIGFELALPAQWNGRYLLMGGGGLNGSIRPATGPVAAGNAGALERGFAVASHDSGHKGAVFDTRFFADQRAALDFAEASVSTVTLTTRMIVEQYYGKPAHHSYMTGCSTGGREGMLASQRYPELFDGIVVGAPAMRPGNSNLGVEYSQVMLNRTLDAATTNAAGFSTPEREVILAGMLAQCDAKDGLADGMIMNVKACRAFDPSLLQCEAGQRDSCISADRLEALKLAFAGAADASGRPAYAPVPWDTGIVAREKGQLPGYLPTGAPGPFGPASTAREIDIDARLFDIRRDAAGRLTDTAYWTNMSTFLARGSKIMFYHGVSDPWFSALDSWDYFKRARETNGAELWDKAARFYMVPGMGHCRGGNAFDNFDLLTPMVAWVEQGETPSAITATRSSDGTAEMPMCPYPQYPRYMGHDPSSAKGYACVDASDMD